LIGQLQTWLTFKKKNIIWSMNCGLWKLNLNIWTCFKIKTSCGSIISSSKITSMFTSNYNFKIIGPMEWPCTTLSCICTLCIFLFSQSEFSAFLGFEINVFIFVSNVLRTMILMETKDVFRRNFQTILESPEFGKWPCYSIPKANK